MTVQYKMVVEWDADLIDVGFCNTLGLNPVKGLADSAIKITTGAPAATVGVWMPGAQVKNAIDGTTYENSGTTAAPVWTQFDTGTAFSLPTVATDATTTTSTSFSLTFSALTSGVGQKLIGSGATMTTGSVQQIVMGAAITGAAQSITNTGVYTGTVGMRTLVANSLTTGTIDSISATGLTTGKMRVLIGGGANMTSAAILDTINMGAATAGIGLQIITTGVYVTGSAGLLNLVANSATTTTGLLQISATGLTSGTITLLTGGGVNMTAGAQLSVINMGIATTGQGEQITTTGIYTGLNGIWQLTANSATTGTIARINATGLTSGNGLYAVGGGANMISGGNVANFDMGAGIAGSALLLQTSGAYAGTDGVSRLTATAATTGVLDVISAAGLTSGIAHQVITAVATLTSGRFYSANNGATEVFGIGANGHIHSTVSSAAPSCAITAAHGITAATITAGSSDTCGIITTTGTQDNTTDSTFTLTFGKTYTVAPKSIVLTGANNSGAGAGTGEGLPYIVSISATAVIIGVSKSANAAATPSWYYQIIA